MKTRRRMLVNGLLLTGSVLSCTIATVVKAQEAVIPPLHRAVDANGVDLFTGAINLRTPGISVGNGDRALGYAWAWYGMGWATEGSLAITRTGNVLNVGIGDKVYSFNQSGSTFASRLGDGSTLTFSGTIYTFTGADGTVVHFNKALGSTGYDAVATDLTRADGGQLFVDWTSGQYCVEAYPGEPDTCRRYQQAVRLAGLRNHANFSLRYTYASNTLDRDRAGWMQLTGAQAYNLSVSASTAIQGMAISQSWDGTYSHLNISDALGRTTEYRYLATELYGVKFPGNSGEAITASYAGGRVNSITNAGVTANYSSSDSGNVRTVTVTNAASQTTTYTFDIALMQITSKVDPLGRRTEWQYDTAGRMTKETLPEGNGTQITYDGRGNPVTTVQFAKGGPASSIFTTSATYEAGCSNPKTCNQPVTTTDARGNVTNYAYASHGGVESITYPAGNDGVRPQVRYSYAALSSPANGQTIYELSGTSACRTAAPGACVGGADEVKTTIAYDTANLFAVSQTTAAGDGSLSATSSASYDATGNVVAVDGPLAGNADTTTFGYDAMRTPLAVITPDPDGSGPLKRRITLYHYADDGLVDSITQGTTDANGGSFQALQYVFPGYDGNRRKVEDRLYASGGTYWITRYGYDGVGRLLCTAVRMDPSRWNGQNDACAPQTDGPYGPDRVQQRGYDAAGQLVAVQSAFGTAEATVERMSYTSNGLVATVTDGMNNRTTNTYDGFDRLVDRQFPAAPQGANASNGYDHEEYAYDAAGNMVSRRLRSGQVVSYGYDALNRLLHDSPPGERGVAYGYDLLGHLTQAAYDNLGGPDAVAFAYDALGRVKSSTSGMGGVQRTVSYGYDAAGNRTSITHPDGVSFGMSYDVSGALRNATWWTPATGTVPFLAITLDDLGRRTEINRASSYTGYGYDPASRMTSQDQRFANGSGNTSVSIGYNPASQIASRTNGNDDYAWPGAVNADRSYTANGLNQYTGVGPNGYGYDGRGNLTSDGGNSYGYDLHNRMTSASTSGGTTLGYDPLGRLWQVSSPQRGNTQFLYDGDHVVAEYDGTNGAMRRRYFWGPGADEPIVQDEGGAMNCGGTKFLHGDERGSVVGVASCWGDRQQTNSYDEAGIPASGNLGRFQYTGQAWLPELGLYYYKARMYSPTLGRFMQTDPIGYGDGLNWYNYAGGDPVNATDPSGLEERVYRGTDGYYFYHRNPFARSVVSRGGSNYDPGNPGFSEEERDRRADAAVARNHLEEPQKVEQPKCASGLTFTGTDAKGGAICGDFRQPEKKPSALENCLNNAAENASNGASFNDADLARKDSARVGSGYFRDSLSPLGTNFLNAIGSLLFYNIGYYIGRSCSGVRQR